MDGACVFNPFGRELPPQARVATRPLVERHGALWFWPGDENLADPATIPDFGFIDDDRDARDHLLMDVNYELIADNLLDLSHAEFLHVETFGVNGALFDPGGKPWRAMIPARFGTSGICPDRARPHGRPPWWVMARRLTNGCIFAGMRRRLWRCSSAWRVTMGKGATFWSRPWPIRIS
jgi:phenylpropionate dioxygenase-like ring-hydroxylating dioxygenase large terminal subunit